MFQIWLASAGRHNIVHLYAGFLVQSREFWSAVGGLCISEICGNAMELQQRPGGPSPQRPRFIKTLETQESMRSHVGLLPYGGVVGMPTAVLGLLLRLHHVA